jgi:hypothetical protein
MGSDLSTDRHPTLCGDLSETVSRFRHPMERAGLSVAIAGRARYAKQAVADDRNPLLEELDLRATRAVTRPMQGVARRK